MKEKGQSSVAVVSFHIGKAFGVPLSHLTGILSTICLPHFFIGAYEKIHLSGSNDSKNISFFNYPTSPVFIARIVAYFVLQTKISFRLLLVKHKFGRVIYFMSLPPLIPMLIAKILNVKSYWLLSASPMKLSLSPDDKKSRQTGFSAKICFRLTDYIVLYSPILVSDWDLESYRHKILIAHEHFLDFNIFTVTTPLASRPPLIGYIGRLSVEKGIQNFAPALHRILNDRQDLRVLIGGDGQLEETTRTSLQEEGLAARVDLPGWISRDDLPKHLNQLRLLVLPSYTEGLPNIILEAMACGTPVLATPVGAIPDVVVDGVTGFIMENNSPGCIAENVLRALNAPDLERIAENGRQFVKMNFSFESTAARWKELLEKV
ncbi:glycosyltransferase family 4 protein [Methanoculleus sp. Wushi-C6]|uniref:Glycosyltransferase family 4 protein n=1 Tax=Methanoculleus caldifontis TaxID=2651577 RepID=A0ABU3X259_9EURY|nr:glycosyltransferase family 4 protein [Methanoculleus sp. Wushi-C6]MDV2482140.1 glycosyltransferase family 4 protein [Methanoculleus sp. Wushi-C6]